MCILNDESAIAYTRNLLADFGQSITVYTVRPCGDEHPAMDVEFSIGNESHVYTMTVWVERYATGPRLYGEW